MLLHAYFKPGWKHAVRIPPLFPSFSHVSLHLSGSDQRGRSLSVFPLSAQKTGIYLWGGMSENTRENRSRTSLI